MTIRNDLVYAHQLVKQDNFINYAEIKIENNQIRVRDVGSQGGVYVKLNHNTPLFLQQDQFIMFNDVAGMLIKNHGLLDTDSDLWFIFIIYLI